MRLKSLTSFLSSFHNLQKYGIYRERRKENLIAIQWASGRLTNGIEFCKAMKAISHEHWEVLHCGMLCSRPLWGWGEFLGAPWYKPSHPAESYHQVSSAPILPLPKVRAYTSVLSSAYGNSSEIGAPFPQKRPSLAPWASATTTHFLQAFRKQTIAPLLITVWWYSK